MHRRFRPIHAPFLPWLSLALLCGACSSSPSDHAASGGSSGAGGSGAGGSNPGGTGGSSSSCGRSSSCDACPDGSWADYLQRNCKPWTECQPGKAALNTPSNYTDRICARVEFKRQLGTSDYDEDVQLAVNPDGIICVAGTRNHEAGGSPVGGFVAKYAADGTQLWFNDFRAAGGSIRSVAVNGAGNCYTLGAASRPATGGGEWRVREYDAAGAEAWSATGPIEGLTPHKLDIDQTGNLVATFLTQAPSQPSDLYQVEVMKFAANGSSLWSASAGPKDDWSTWFTVAGDEPLVVRSEEVTSPNPTQASVSVTRLGADGSELSQSTYPQSNIYNVVGLGVAPDRSVVLGGLRLRPDGQPIASVWRLEPDGNGTQLDLVPITPQLLRLAADGSFWTYDRFQLDDRFIHWSSGGVSSTQLRLPTINVFEFHSFEPGPGYLLLAGTGDLNGESRFGYSDAFLIKLLVD